MCFKLICNFTIISSNTSFWPIFKTNIFCIIFSYEKLVLILHSIQYRIGLYDKRGEYCQGLQILLWKRKQEKKLGKILFPSPEKKQKKKLFLIYSSRKDWQTLANNGKVWKSFTKFGKETIFTVVWERNLLIPCSCHTSLIIFSNITFVLATLGCRCLMDNSL